MQAGAEAPLPIAAMLVLPAELTHRQARAVLQVLRRGVLALPSGARAVVDARALTQFDTSALAVLLECRRTALARGQTFAVQGLAPALASMAVLYGVQDLLPAAD